MNDRERYIATVLGEPVDRPPFLLSWGPWDSTRKRWLAEGQPTEVIDHRQPFGPDQPPLALPINTGPWPQLSSGILEQDEDYYVALDSWGIRRRYYKHGESMSDFLEFPVKNWADWEDYRDRYLDPDDPARLAGDWRARGQEWMAKGYPIQLGYYPDAGVFGPYRWLVGDEEGLAQLCTQPRLAHAIMDHITSLYLTVWEKVVQEVRVDVIHLWEDMCYRSGPLISPRMWQEFLGPQYRRIQAFAYAHNIPVISVDTDGNPDQITPSMLAAGVNLLFPLEVAAGCDINAWQRKYPKLAFAGGIDKRTLAQGPEAISTELARIRPAIRRGRYIPELDHLVPDDVSWENYCYFALSLRGLIMEV
jgi:hypothetical protein